MYPEAGAWIVRRIFKKTAVMKKARVTISGKVQGVWFRSSTRDKAMELGVNGYVRNLVSGDVEFIAEGDDSNVDMLIQWAGQGPPLAYVNDIKVDVLEYNGEFKDFRIKY